MTSRRGKTLPDGRPEAGRYRPGSPRILPGGPAPARRRGAGRGLSTPTHGVITSVDTTGHARSALDRRDGMNTAPRRGHWRGRRAEGEDPGITLYRQR